MSEAGVQEVDTYVERRQNRTIYRNTVHYGPVSGGSAAPRISGIEGVVVTGGNISRGDTGGGSGGGGRNGLGDAGGRGGRGRDGELRKKYTVVFNTIGKETSDTLVYDLGSENNHPTTVR